MKTHFLLQTSIASVLLASSAWFWQYAGGHYGHFGGALEMLGGTLAAAFLGYSSRAVMALLRGRPHQAQGRAPNEPTEASLFGISGACRQNNGHSADRRVKLPAPSMPRDGTAMRLDGDAPDEALRLLRWDSAEPHNGRRQAVQIPRALTLLAPAFAVPGLARAREKQAWARQHQLVRAALNQYVGASVVAQIMADPSRLRLGGERKVLTMFFSDLQASSSLAERLDPESFTELLNDYLTDMSGIILDEGGTLDKYQGDAIVAFWNAPEEQPDHARRACRAALRCQKRLAERAEDYRRRVGSGLRTRIGLHTGEVMVGNMGCQVRFDYSVVGAAANLTARLENANKAFGTAIMVSEAVWRETGGRFVGREIGLLKVSGRTEPVRVYELLGHEGEAEPAGSSVYRAALALCQDGRWDEAEARFASLADDPLSRVYAKRCRTAQAEQGWDGIWLLDRR